LPLSSVTVAQPSVAVLALSILGGVMLLLPRGLKHRWLGLILFMPLFSADQTPLGHVMQLDVLDVGQGTAVLLSSHAHLLLYDSGPGDGADFDLVDSVIRPAILQSGHRSPDRILISHADLDHAGGLRRLRARYPAAKVYASLPAALAGVESCDDRLAWNWDGIGFRVLHPSTHLPYIGNDSSCVLSVNMGKVNILLPGDISTATEQRLLRAHRESLNLLLVPHHGSKTSSSVEFLHVKQPSVAIATAGLGNRFGFPHREVQYRYRSAGIPLWSTDACGAIRVVLSDDGALRAFSARRLRPAPWRWPAGTSCP